jgi:hypothetical protein
MPNGNIVRGIIVIAAVAVIASVIFISLPETPDYTAAITRHDNTIKVITDNEGKINADRLWVSFKHPGFIQISNRSGNIGDIFDYDPTADIEGGDYTISGEEEMVSAYSISVCVYYSYKGRNKTIKEKKFEIE